MKEYRVSFHNLEIVQKIDESIESMISETSKEFRKSNDCRKYTDRELI